MRISDWSSDVCSSDLSAEAILDGAQDAILVTALALEAQYRIDHMFQHARSCDAAVFRDVTAKDQSGAAFLGKANQFLRCRTHLADCARSAFAEITMQDQQSTSLNSSHSCAYSMTTSA